LPRIKECLEFIKNASKNPDIDFDSSIAIDDINHPPVYTSKNEEQKSLIYGDSIKQGGDEE
jgi:hypothetical protein